MLTGERVTLRPQRADDLPMLYEMRVELATWSARTDVPPYPMTLEQARELAEQRSRDGADNADFVAEVDGQVVGRGGLFAFDNLAGKNGGADFRTLSIGAAYHM